MKAKLAIQLMAMMLACSIAYGQNQVGNAVQSAYQKINEGQLESAMEDLRSLIDKNDRHFGALTALGYAYRMSKKYAESVDLYKKAHESDPTMALGKFNLGVAYGLAQMNDEAFRTLLEVKSNNQFNITNIGLSPAAAILKEDKRWASLFPSKEEYAYPFVEENIKIIHDWHGETKGDQFGWIARNIGDVNGDGYNDLTSSAPTNNEGGLGAGKIYVHSGKSGKLLWSFASPDEAGQLGMSIDAAEDVNGDGIPDVVAGAPYVNKTWVFSGKDGEVLFSWKGENNNGAFGRCVKGVGDVNNDGFGDVLVGEPFQIWGAPLNSDKIDQKGNVYLYSGKNGALLKQWTGERIGDGFGTAVTGKTTGTATFIMVGAPAAGNKNAGEVTIYKGTQSAPFFTISADSTGSRLGDMFMSVVGDVNADGTKDIYVSDFSNNALGNATGRAYVYSGESGAMLYEFTGENAGDGFGIGVADAGDINQDGFDDLVIGAWQYRSVAPAGGKIYVYSGRNGGIIREITGSIVGETLGFDTTGIGDIDGDGVPDLLLTSAWSAINGTQSGRMLIISGK